MSQSHRKGKRLGGMPISFYLIKTKGWDPLGVGYYLVFMPPPRGCGQPRTQLVCTPNFSSVVSNLPKATA